MPKKTKKDMLLLSTCDNTSSQFIANYVTPEVVCVNFYSSETRLYTFCDDDTAPWSTSTIAVQLKVNVGSAARFDLYVILLVVVKNLNSMLASRRC